MRISENMLLDGYDGLTNGLAIISLVKGDTVVWAYRNWDDGHPGAMVTGRDDAACILLDYDREGCIDLAKRLTEMQAATVRTIGIDYARNIGAEV